MRILIITILLFATFSGWAIKKDKNETVEVDTTINSTLVNGLKLRNIGPAWASGRIADFAVNSKDTKEYYVGVASGHVWKTKNNGTTWEPVFDNYGAYSIGDVEMDSNNHNVIWVGTGENNHQRALGYGDGIYKSVDGGKSFKNMGLKESRQIGGIVIDPRNSNVVYVACEGSAWGPGGDRGLYKTTDGGKNWEKILEISENTGVNNIIMDPLNPDILYATSEQRRRTHFAKIGGGPESAVYKSTDAGKSWYKIMKGLPKVDIGGMGITVSPADPNVVYLIVEAADDESGFYRSTDKGESWNKMSSYSASGQYYNEIYCDPDDVDKVYSMETYSKVTKDAGKTWKNIGNNKRHVDDHAFWIDPNDTQHFMIGSDGGIYESWDDGKNWDFKENLPVTQFYRVSVDNAEPFYNVYGGTQDNNTMGGPSRNIRKSGVTNDEWYETLGGDGFWSAIDPTDPNIVYCEYQYGNIYRYDKKSGEEIFIKPRERKGEKSYKWNWDTPMIMSRFSNTRLYMAANKVFKSDDRGNTWEVISEDLTAKVDRNSFPVMGKYWSSNAVVKDVSTSLWGTIVAMAESPIKEGMIIVGTDDGVISITEDDGKTWRQIKTFPGITEYTYISDVLADRFDENIIYATFRNLKRDDFKPYILKSSDKGKSWKSISSNLPENGSVHTLAQDFVNKNLLFAGTEFGIFFTVDAGENWVQLKSGIPTIAIRDIALQERENDLVLASFGRGFYILDNYSPLRELTTELVEKEAHLFEVKDALMYIQPNSRDNQGSTYFFAKNPAYGATFTYYLKEAPKSKKEVRKEKEKELFKEGKPIPQISWREAELEGLEEKAHLIFTVFDEDDNVVAKITKAPVKGVNRVTWNLRYDQPSVVSVKNKFDPTKIGGNKGILAMPGKYKVGMSLWANGELEVLSEPVEFICKKLNNVTLASKDYADNKAFAKEVSKLSVVMAGSNRLVSELYSRMEYIKKAIYSAPAAKQEHMDKARGLSKELEEINFMLNGVKAKASWEEIPPAQMPLLRRLGNLTETHLTSTSAITSSEKMELEILKEEFPPVLKSLKNIVEKDIPELESELNKVNAPWTPGRLPEWK